ncbi:hypothetical protein [Vibrio sp. 10N]|uniref:hypothetical protein n=1 Tax=Vibrio sp. 10N TaxID=3058938 RepID=UPI002812F89B|nr:hypothetical protein VB10N_40980 [Vibrio sp. 10N]
MEDTLDIVSMCVMDDRSFIMAYLIGAASMALWVEFRRSGTKPRRSDDEPKQESGKTTAP